MMKGVAIAAAVIVAALMVFSYINANAKRRPVERIAPYVEYSNKFN
jgi:hypothetical protein